MSEGELKKQIRAYLNKHILDSSEVIPPNMVSAKTTIINQVISFIDEAKKDIFEAFKKDLEFPDGDPALMEQILKKWFGDYS